MNDKVYKLMNWPKIEEIIYSECDSPSKILGPHKQGNMTLIQAFAPGAVAAEICFAESEKSVKMELADEDGYFAALIAKPFDNLPAYTYIFTYEDKSKQEREECYRFHSLFAEEEINRFRHGILYDSYNKLGAHPCMIDGRMGTNFAVWAPSAMRVSVVGDFNQWDGRIHQMNRLGDSGIFELFIPEAAVGDNYKFELKLKTGLTYLKADPYCNAAQLRPNTASVITSLEGFSWEDGAFVKNRISFQNKKSPLSIYELYLGSFINNKSNEGIVNYRQIALKLIPYIKEMGYTHVEIMPIMEHPLDESLGYQIIGYYSPTARYGTPKDFMFFVNELHKADIGVILDWVPSYFPKDINGLADFDGTCLYEHKDPRQGVHPLLGTLLYNYGRNEVSNYLISNACFWIDKYHVDGLRFVGVDSMLYLDFAKNDGEWIPNMYGGNENLDAIEFIKHTNSILHKKYEGILTIAEDCTTYPGVTESLDKDGLGFDYKWDSGFKADILSYMCEDPIYRKYHHDLLSSQLLYAYSENFLLAFSHNDVSERGKSLLTMMPGTREQQFANLRLLYSYQFLHPGKKMIFMGQDIGEFEPWNDRRGVEWYLRTFKEHNGVAALVADLNHLYRSYNMLAEMECVPEGFAWLNHMAANEGYLTFMRYGKTEEEALLVACNFSGKALDMSIGVPKAGKYKEIFNSDAENYGGTDYINPRVKKSVASENEFFDYSVAIKLAPLSLSVLKYIPFTDDEISVSKALVKDKKRGKK